MAYFVLTMLGMIAGGSHRAAAGHFLVEFDVLKKLSELTSVRRNRRTKR